MAEQLWRRCPNASPRSDEYGWGCDCHGLGRYATLVPAVLIEDLDAAVERIATWLRESGAFGQCNQCGLPEDNPTDEYLAAVAKDALAAAVGTEGT